MDKPHIADAPGLAWRPRRNGWAAVWLARQDIAKKGFKPSTRQIAVFELPPTESEENDVRAACVTFQEEMYEFGNEQPKVFGGTIHALIVAYQKDPDSPYKSARWYSRHRGLDVHLRHLDKKYGALRLADLGARDFNRIYNEIRYPDGKDKPERQRLGMAHAAITAIRMMLSFGMAFEIEKSPRDKISECARLRTIIGELKFEKGAGRKEVMTLRQCEDVIAAANADGLHSMALAQALQRDLGIRQRDAIGEWVPVTEPGISVTDHYHGRKWLRGIRWEEISSGMVLTHAMSKSRSGKTVEFDLKLYPMVMAELDKIQREKRTGPLVVCEITGRPWTQNHFRLKWREMATKGGLPPTVQNRDSRAGAITEIIAATGGNLEAARKQAGHSDTKTTQIYSREVLKSNSDTAVITADFRAKNRG